MKTPEEWARELRDALMLSSMAEEVELRMMAETISQAVAAEREACAMTADELEEVRRVFQTPGFPKGLRQQIVDAIRARG